MKIRQEFVREI